MTDPRIIFDVTTLAQAGPRPDGIVRTVRALAQCAAADWPNVRFAIFDAASGRFHEIDGRWLANVLEGARIDLSARGAASLLRRPRRRAFVALEGLRLRLAGRSAPVELLQRLLMSKKYKADLIDSQGNRRPLFPYGMAVGQALELGPRDIILETGSDWPALQRIARGIRPDGGGPRLVLLCHDIIPMLYPQFFLVTTATSFRACFAVLLPASSLVVFTTERVRSDAEQYCAQHRIALSDTAVVRLGTDLSATAARRRPTDGLTPGRYALFVSTIEPRKGHAMLVRVWKRLLESGVPQSRDFRLVLAGRQGWLVDTLIGEIRELDGQDSNFHWIANADDDQLATLYSDAAFCVYPSVYEGFGLPIVEAFRHGKAVLASSGGALPETVGPYSPCIDPLDEEAWYVALKRWIEDPSARAVYEDAIKNGYEPRQWSKAAADLLGAIQGRFALVLLPMLSAMSLPTLL